MHVREVKSPKKRPQMAALFVSPMEVHAVYGEEEQAAATDDELYSRSSIGLFAAA